MNNSRHSGIFTIPHSASVDIIGAGGLGGTTALTLAKMGYRYMNIYDGDVVAEENTGTQLFKPSDIGKSKVEAITDTLRDFSDDILVVPYQERVKANTPLFSPIIISAVDSINARKAIWEAVLISDNDFYIEMRMGAEELQVHTVMMGEMDWYDEYITAQTEEGIADLPCTEKATFFTSMVAAGLVGSIVRKLHSGIAVPHKTIFNIRHSTYMEI